VLPAILFLLGGSTEKENAKEDQLNWIEFDWVTTDIQGQVYENPAINLLVKLVSFRSLLPCRPT
jgi:hypothetical protein